jgi:lipopolysaccharide/colanic/teichoic acid biosynthesis glycosyltransferase
MVSAAVIFPVFRTSRAVWRFATIGDYLRVLAATGATVAGAIALDFGFDRLDGIGRSLPVLQGLLILTALVGGRVMFRLWGEAKGRSRLKTPPTVASKPSETVLVIGAGKLTTLYLRAVKELAPHRVRIAGLLVPDEVAEGRFAEGHPILGMPSQVEDVLRDLEVHGVFVDCIVVAKAFEELKPQSQSALLEIEKSTSIRLNFLVDQLGLAPLASGRPTAEVSTAEATDRFAESCFCDDDLLALARRPYWRVKRVLDFLAALICLIFLAPLILFAAILVVADLGFPLTFWQQRPGLDGRPLTLHKFRTMAAAHDANGDRLPDEMRTSKIGLFLRRTRFDEFPQILNILSGEMSFIGPRPLLPVDQPSDCAARLLIPPGLTGWAQVKGGRVISPADKAALDLWYLRNASLALDLEILARTVPMVLFGETVDTAAIQTAWRELDQPERCTSKQLSLKATREAPLHRREFADPGRRV